jgi:hypothetical protein
MVCHGRPRARFLSVAGVEFRDQRPHATRDVVASGSHLIDDGLQRALARRVGFDGSRAHQRGRSHSAT